MKSPILYILCGIPFSGKSTLARQLVSELGFVRVDLDEVKFDLFGQSITDEQIDQSGWDKIYQEMYTRIRKNLSKGNNVLNDTGNFTKYERDLVRKEAEKVGAKSKVIFVNIPEDIARERWLKNKKTLERFDISQEAFESAVKEMEVPSPSEDVFEFTVNDNVEELIRIIKTGL